MAKKKSKPKKPAGPTFKVTSTAKIPKKGGMSFSFGANVKSGGS